MGRRHRAVSSAATSSSNGWEDGRGGLDDSLGDDDDDALRTVPEGTNLPAHLTKHLSTLNYHFPSLRTTFHLSQTDTSGSTGSSLWLSSQLLASHLISLHARSGSSSSSASATKGQERGRAIELGSGTGLLSLLLARLGWRVTATDVEPVLSAVLRRNVEAGRYELAQSATAAGGKVGSVEVRELDWTVPPSAWRWDDAESVTASSPSIPSVMRSEAEEGTAMPDFDLVLTADTVYEPSLVRPLFRTLSHLHRRHSFFHCAAQDGGTTTKRRPRVLLALERRDAATIDAALAVARDEFGLDFQRIPHRKVVKAFDAYGDGKAWSRDEWSGVEIWQL